MYRLASKAVGTGARSLRPATRVSALQQTQARSFSGAQRMCQGTMHAPKVNHDDTVMWLTFGTVGASVFFGMWYTLLKTGTSMSGHFRVRDINVQDVLDRTSKHDLPRI